MKKLLLTAVCLFILTLGYSQNATKIWETEASLKVPESVLLDKNVLYVSNIDGNPDEKNGKGFISTLSMDGKINKLTWVNGLNAPKGMGLYNGFLYVSDIDRVAVINVSKGTIDHFIEIPNTKFLNDITVCYKGNVAVSDMKDNAIYLIKDNKAQLLIKDEKLVSVNGLFFEDDVLFIGTSNIIYKYDLASDHPQLEVYIQNTGGIDGLERCDANRFIISDWSGKVQIVSPDASPIEVLNFTDNKYNAADIEFDISSKTLYIPTFFGNTVAAYRIK